MKKLLWIGFILTIPLINNCRKDDRIIKGEFEFIVEYKTHVVVGGFVGIAERTFKIGEVYNGRDDGGETVTIRIAEHSDWNNNCPNSWCYQELLEVPRELLKLRK